jgi:hypothetical protein
MFNLCFPFIPSLFYIVLNDDYMLCKVSLGVLKGASKLNVLLFIINNATATPDAEIHSCGNRTFTKRKF